MRDGLIENVQETLGITIRAEFDLKMYFRRIPTVRKNECNTNLFLRTNSCYKKSYSSVLLSIG